MSFKASFIAHCFVKCCLSENCWQSVYPSICMHLPSGYGRRSSVLYLELEYWLRGGVTADSNGHTCQTLALKAHPAAGQDHFAADPVALSPSQSLLSALKHPRWLVAALLQLLWKLLVLTLFGPREPESSLWGKPLPLSLHFFPPVVYYHRQRIAVVSNWTQFEGEVHTALPDKLQSLSNLVIAWRQGFSWVYVLCKNPRLHTSL